MRLAALTLFLVAPLLLADDKADPKDPKAPKAREISVKGLPTERGGFGKPAKMDTEAEMKKIVLDETAQKEISKQVNFKKEYLLLFRWAGSGGDKVSFTTKDGEVTFDFKRGLTRDLRMHSKLFAIPKDAKYKLPGAAKKGGGGGIKRGDR
jgi:hypothetical protein